jgi:hypothetical protein
MDHLRLRVVLLHTLASWHYVQPVSADGAGRGERLARREGKVALERESLFSGGEPRCA